jgi:hypothetical protein
VNRFVRALESTQEPPFRRMEVQPGEELQVDFGTGAKIRSEQGTYRQGNRTFNHRLNRHKCDPELRRPIRLAYACRECCL